MSDGSVDKLGLRLQIYFTFSDFKLQMSHSRSSSSSSTGGRADAICWISLLESSVDWSGPSRCSCWLTQEELKPPSSCDGLEGDAAASADPGGERGRLESKVDVSRRARFKTALTFLRLPLRRRGVCWVPLRPVGVRHVDQPHHGSCRRTHKVSQEAVPLCYYIGWL